LTSRKAPCLKTNLRELRKARGLALRDVEREVGVSLVTVMYAEQGRGVNLETALRLARFYGRTVEEIWQLPGEK
jgi:transcriptional regulator with XRE-family HTH domain